MARLPWKRKTADGRRAPRSGADKRLRRVVTPEGVALPFAIGSRAARASALLLDLLFIVGSMVGTTLLLAWVAGGFGGNRLDQNTPVAHARQALAIAWIIAMFLYRNAYFLFFELGPRGATPGKRICGLRIAARDGGRLTTEAVIARNLVRDIELFMPLVFLASAWSSGADGEEAGWAGLVWFAIFVLFPFFNRDALRCGDVIAGTWVVDAPPQAGKGHVAGRRRAGRARSPAPPIALARRNWRSMANTSCRCWSACCATARGGAGRSRRHDLRQDRLERGIGRRARLPRGLLHAIARKAGAGHALRPAQGRQVRARCPAGDVIGVALHRHRAFVLRRTATRRAGAGAARR
jgi:uncharacterized RDD family membrane protein YckC